MNDVVTAACLVSAERTAEAARIKVLERIEVAIDAHPSLRRPGGLLGEATLEFTRQGWTACVRVLGPRRRVSTEVHGHGNDPGAAADELISGLDSWAQVLGERR